MLLSIELCLRKNSYSTLQIKFKIHIFIKQPKSIRCIDACECNYFYIKSNIATIFVLIKSIFKCEGKTNDIIFVCWIKCRFMKKLRRVGNWVSVVATLDYCCDGI